MEKPTKTKKRKPEPGSGEAESVEGGSTAKRAHVEKAEGEVEGLPPAIPMDISTPTSPGKPHRKNYQDKVKAVGTAPDSFTENMAPAFSTTGDARLDLFFSGLLRGCKRDNLFYLLRKSWAQSPLHTVALLLHARDCRGGKGEREVVMEALIWLRRHYPKTYALNLKNLLEVGCYRDLLAIAAKVSRARAAFIAAGANPPLEPETAELQIMCDTLGADEKTMDGADPNDGKRVAISLAGKWAPTEKGFYDKPEQGRLAKQIRKMMYPGVINDAQRYRQLLVKLRTHLKIVEQLLCDQKWDRINFGSVPSRAHNLYRNCFKKHQKERYEKYLEDVKEGKAKINTTGLMPHQLAGPYLKYLNGGKQDDTLEAQWNDLINKLKAEGNIENGLAVVDVSGSMYGTPLEVAVSLGLVLCLLSSNPWTRQLITFSSEPEWFEVKGDTLFEMANNVKGMNWQMSTNFNKVFRLILSRAMKEGSAASDLPSTIFVFSDMQFDQCGGRNLTNYDQMREEYKAAGYEIPQLVFWNLNGEKVTFPTRAGQHGVALISGFSSDLMKLFLNGGELSSVEIMLMAIKKYEELVQIDESEV